MPTPSLIPNAKISLRLASASGLAALVAGLTLALHGQPVTADEAVQVRLEVSSLRNLQGVLNCRLFNEAADFPDGEGLRTVRVAIDGARGACVFSQLVPGTYAVAVVHDENSNGRLDKNLLGVPTEGYGVSNNRTYALSSPKWEESRFTVTTGKPVDLRVSLRY